MRLDARKGDVGWTVIDIPTGREIGDFCVWVDDDSAQWGEFARPLRSFADEPPLIVHQERRIAIYPDRRLNPVEDLDDESVDASTEQGMLA